MKQNKSKFAIAHERAIKKWLKENNYNDKLQKINPNKRRKKKKKKKPVKKKTYYKTKEQYYNELLDVRWFNKRKEILKLDEYMCRNCGNTNDLQVHHKTYIDGLKAWEYSNNDLITLCRKCHKRLHGLDL